MSNCDKRKNNFLKQVNVNYLTNDTNLNPDGKKERKKKKKFRQ